MQMSDEMLHLIKDLKADRDELRRHIDGWCTRITDLEKQTGAFCASCRHIAPRTVDRASAPELAGGLAGGREARRWQSACEYACAEPTDQAGLG